MLQHASFLPNSKTQTEEPLLNQRSLEWANNPVTWCTAILLWLLEKLIEDILNLIKEAIMNDIGNNIHYFMTNVISAAIAGLDASLNARGAIKRSLCEKCPNWE